MIRITGYGVINEKPRVGKVGHFFSVHAVGKTMRWMKKNECNLLWWARRALTMQSLGKIAQCAPAVGGKMWCLFFYRQDRRVAANCRYCFYSQAKNRVFRTARATRCTDSGQTLHYRRAPGSACLCKISRQSVETGGMRPQNIKNFHFLAKSRPIGATPLTDFQNF